MNEQALERRVIRETTLLHMLEHEKALTEMLLILQYRIALFKAATGAGGQ